MWIDRLASKQLRQLASTFPAVLVTGARQTGKTSLVRHDEQGLFTDLPNPLKVARYHSLVVAQAGLPPDLVATAHSEEGEIMALSHRRHPVIGLQFHPEAVLTEHGLDMLRNFFGVTAMALPAAPLAAADLPAKRA